MEDNSEYSLRQFGTVHIIQLFGFVSRGRCKFSCKQELGEYKRNISYRGRADNRSVSPRCPTCPPCRLPDGQRRLRVLLAQDRSAEGGRLELCESFATSASSSEFLSPNLKFSPCSWLTSACSFLTCRLEPIDVIGQGLDLPLLLIQFGSAGESSRPKADSKSRKRALGSIRWAPHRK